MFKYLQHNYSINGLIVLVDSNFTEEIPESYSSMKKIIETFIKVYQNKNFDFLPNLALYCKNVLVEGSQSCVLDYLEENFPNRVNDFNKYMILT